MSSALSIPTNAQKATNMQNADGSAIYAAGAWSFKNSSGVAVWSSTDAGAWTLGSSTQLYKPAYTGNYAIVGNSTGQNIVVANGGTGSFRLGASNASGMFILSDGGGRASLWFYDYSSSTFTRIAGSSVHVAGAPGATQLGLTYAATDAVVTITAGASGGQTCWITVIGSYL